MKDENLDIKSLTFFKYMAESKNISKTADFFGIPQSSVSYHITHLENYLGNIRLFDRSTRPMKLTKLV